MNRLTEVRKETDFVRRYTYDAFGNRTRSEEKQNGIRKETSYTYNNLNQLLHLEERVLDTGEADVTKVLHRSYQYDNRGNLTEIMQDDQLLQRHEYNPNNQLTKIMNSNGESTTHLYNGLGYRAESMTPEGAIHYVTDFTRAYHNLLMQETKDGSQHFIWDGNVVSTGNDTETAYYLQDELGSPIRFLDDTGNLIDHYGYDEFGQSLSVSTFERKDQGRHATLQQPFGYTGYQTDKGSSLYFAQARYYDPATSRMASEDPYRVGLNWYTYCYNNPMIYVDLNGLDPTSYIYYMDDFKREAEWQMEQLEAKGIDVIPCDLTITRYEDKSGKERALNFMNTWNHMEDKDGIDSVYIFCHGSERMLQFEDGSKYNALTIDGMNQRGNDKVAGDLHDLERKDVTLLYVQACNTGLTDYYKVENINAASILSEKIEEDGTVYAWNGSVSFGPPEILQRLCNFIGLPYSLEGRTSKKQGHYDDIIAELIENGDIKAATGELGIVTYQNGKYVPDGYYPETSTCEGSE